MIFLDATHGQLLLTLAPLHHERQNLSETACLNSRCCGLALGQQVERWKPYAQRQLGSLKQGQRQHLSDYACEQAHLNFIRRKLTHLPAMSILKADVVPTSATRSNKPLATARAHCRLATPYCRYRQRQSATTWGAKHRRSSVSCETHHRYDASHWLRLGWISARISIAWSIAAVPIFVFREGYPISDNLANLKTVDCGPGRWN